MADQDNTYMIADYYNKLAPYYHLMLADWEASMVRQAHILDAVIREFVNPEAHFLLDAACGVGTQTLGLAQLGYLVTGSDIAAEAVARANAEALKRGLDATFVVCDMRAIGNRFEQQFDVVLACDNAIPHLLSDPEILEAFQNFIASLAPAGGCVLSVRDYASMNRTGTQLIPRHIHVVDGIRYILFDIWDFQGDFYDFSTYIVKDSGPGRLNTEVISEGRYYCVSIARLEQLLRQAGFAKVVVLKDRFYQPLLIATKS